MYIAILGRQPALGMGELEATYGSDNVRWFSDQSATIASSSFSIDQLGGAQKAGQITAQLSNGDWRRASVKIVQTYLKEWTGFEGKLTLGISAYGFDVSPREVQKTGIILKQKLKTNSVSVRLIPNDDTAISSAASHHNKLGLAGNKKELIVVRSRSGKIIIAESIGAQNITAYALRDQKRPKRDAFVGMLPPKLAQIMINLATPAMSSRSVVSASKHLQSESEPTPALDVTPGAKPEHKTLLDPFCGTGVILQEAALMGYRVYGTDLADKMIDFSQANLDWLADSHHMSVDAHLHQGDAMDTKWQSPIDAVACESYLGQPFSAPPSPSKLEQVRGNCNNIIAAFLKNVGEQIVPGTPLCVGIPAWRSTNGDFTHLPLTSQLERLGYERREFKNIGPEDLLYYREDQVVARELLVLVKS
jgi:tRNA (guanine10-N2)-dimethyltransferase